jgi:hypothetical protein
VFIGDHMNHCGPHVVVVLCAPVRVFVASAFHDGELLAGPGCTNRNYEQSVNSREIGGVLGKFRVPRGTIIWRRRFL